MPWPTPRRRPPKNRTIQPGGGSVTALGRAADWRIENTTPGDLPRPGQTIMPASGGLALKASPWTPPAVMVKITPQGSGLGLGDPRPTLLVRPQGATIYFGVVK